MATIQNKSDQLRFRGRGPLDAKGLVKTYADLLAEKTWTVDGSVVAYNYMIVGVWLDKTADVNYNGLYYLFDPAVDSPLKSPDTTNPANWHKFSELENVAEIANQLSTIQETLSTLSGRVDQLEKDKVVISRDNEFNYKQKTPILNEICLVDVPGKGLRVKVGDGTTSFNDLPYLDEGVLSTIDSLISRGHLYQGEFYQDAEHTIKLEGVTGKIYIDATTSKLYCFNGMSYETTSVPSASSTVAGVVKLYDTLGTNTDGAVTQKAVTDELNQKFEVDFDKGQEMLIFDTDLDD